MIKSELIRYIENINLKKNYYHCETDYLIDNNYSIRVESEIHVFFIDQNGQTTQDKYTYIPDIDTLKIIYYTKTGKDIEHLMRMEKIKRLELCSRQEIK